MIGEHVDAADVRKRFDEVRGAAEVLVVVGDAGDQHMTDPHGDVRVGEPAQRVEDVLVGVAGEGSVLGGVDVFDVCEDQVAGGHDALPRLVEGLLTRERRKRRVQTRVDAAGMSTFEELCHEVWLEERLAARDGNAALASPVAAVTLCLVEQIVGLSQGATVERPGVGVMAVAAAHGAALQEDYETHAGAVR